MSIQDPFARALRRARVDLGLQQDELARTLSRRAGQKVSQSTVSRWESGKRVPTAEQFEALIGYVESAAPQHVGELRESRSPELPGVALHTLLFGEAPGRRRKTLPVLLPKHWVNPDTPTFTSDGSAIGPLRSSKSTGSNDRVDVLVASDLSLATSLEQVLAPHLSASVRGWSIGDALPEDASRVLTIGWLSNPWFLARRRSRTVSAASALEDWGLEPPRKGKALLVLLERTRIPDAGSGSDSMVTLVGGIGASHTSQAAELFSSRNVIKVAGRIREHAPHDAEVSLVIEVPKDKHERLLLDDLRVHLPR